MTGRHVSIHRFGTLASATTLLLSGQTRLCSVLQHLCYVGRHVSICDLAPLFSTVPYLRVPIVMCPSHSFLLVYTGKHLYNKNMNNE